jgi:hypothetical protein
MITKYKGVHYVACKHFIVIGEPYQVERPEQIGAELRLDPTELRCPQCGDVCAYRAADVIHSISPDGTGSPQRQS